jgi:hypothetical protein
VFLAFFFSVRNYGGATNDLVTGHTIHPVYSGFALPIENFAGIPNIVYTSLTEQRTITISTRDDIVYKTAYFSTDGKTWRAITLSGNSYKNSNQWINGSAAGTIYVNPSTFNLSSAKTFSSRNYVITYSCTRTTNNWDCHSDTWQIRQFNTSLDLIIPNNTTAPPIVCTPNSNSVTCSGATCGTKTNNCGATIICGTCTVTQICSNNVCINNQTNPPINTGQTTYYVATTGSDTNVGSLSLPFRTIQHAADIVNPGDTVIIRDGVYTGTIYENSTIYFHRGGTAGKYITFKAENKWKAILDGGNIIRYGFTMSDSADYIIIEGLEIRNFMSVGASINEDNNEIILRQNHIHDIGRIESGSDGGKSAIDVGAHATNIQVYGNLVHTNGRLNPNTNPSAQASSCIDAVTGNNNCYNHDHGIYIRGNYVNVTNNIFYDHKSGWGIQIWNDPATHKGHIIIADNTFADTNPARDGHILVGGGYTDDIIIQGNLFYNPKNEMINLPVVCSGDGSVTNLIIRNNLANVGAVTVDPVCSTYTISNNYLNRDPLFVNAANRNYHLQAASPAIDAGLCVSGIRNDYDGILRPQGSGCDIGAFESNYSSNINNQSNTQPNNTTNTSNTVQATYYVATNGNDNNPGTITQPFATWQKGFDMAKAGDLVYIRGGIYHPVASSAFGVYISSKSGTAGNPIRVFAYPGETPVMDMSTNTDSSQGNYGIRMDNSNYWHLKGLSLTGASQHGLAHAAAGLIALNSNNNIYEQLKLYKNQGSGIKILYSSEDNLVINCDAYENYDPYSATPGGDADGFDIAEITARAGDERINTVRGCRSWNNSDDGFDAFHNAGIIYFDNCWAFGNGRDRGDGTGFKLGDQDGPPRNYPQRILTNCIAYNNRAVGFYDNFANVLMYLYNNVAYGNPNHRGFGFYSFNTYSVFRNNICYNNGKADAFLSNAVHDHNSWDSSVTVTDADFISVDGSQLLRPRKSDGSLPDITFLKLAAGSDLIDAGVNVGLPYSGNAPDIGAGETN